LRIVADGDPSFKGGTYFDGGIKSVAKEINAATLLHSQPSFEGFTLPTCYQTPGTSLKSTPPRTPRQAKSH
jgi:hypothetical protein